jgi:hypothetical protein
MFPLSFISFLHLISNENMTISDREYSTRSGLIAKVLQVLSEDRSWSPKLIAKALGNPSWAKTISAILRRLAHDGKIHKEGHGWYRKWAVEDILEGRGGPAVFGLHGITIVGHLPQDMVTPPWWPFFASEKGLVEGFGPRLVSVRFKTETTGTIVIQTQGTSEDPLTVQDFLELVGYIEGKLGGHYHIFNLKVTQIGIATDLGTWQFNGGPVTYTPRQWTGALLRIYNKGRQGTRIEAHLNKKDLDLKELISILIQIADKTTKEVKENGKGESNTITGQGPVND